MDARVSALDRLNERETEILKRLASGSSDQEIADELFLSLNTVKWYNRQIYSKLGVNSRTRAIACSRELHLFDDEIPSLPPAPALISTRGGRIPHSDHIPAEITTFIGRKREAADIEALLRKHRLVTLTGPPGTGKTRLALHVARQAAGQYNDGVYFIPLGPVLATSDILWTIAEHLDFQFQARSEPLSQMLKSLREKTLLLVLDNLEHLVSGGGVLTEILAAAPAVKILVTSRERLSLYGEVVYTLGGMVLPGEDESPENAHSEAIELFIERAQSVSPIFDWKPDHLRHIVRICRLVDGAPLGIELAATWMDTLLPQEIADELEHNLDLLEVDEQNVPPSQRSIRAAFDRSWSLLGEEERAAFRRLSVFRGGFTREAGRVVAGVGLRGLQALVNKSLIRHDPHSGRYDVHELLRHYAGEQLELSGEAQAVTQAHAAYFADFMAERWLWMKDHRQKSALSEMEADIENTRAAWHFCIQAGDVSQIKKFLHSLWAIYDVRGWYPAGIDLFEQAVQMMRASPSEEAEICLGWLLAAQGMFSVPVADYDPEMEARASPLLIEHGLYSGTESGPRQGLTLTQNGIAVLRRCAAPDEMMIIPLISEFISASQNRGMESLAVQAAQDCLESATRINDQWAIAKAKQFLAVFAIEDGNYPQAERLAHEAYRAFAASGNNWSSSVVCIEVLGLLAITQHQFNVAREWIERGLKEAEEIAFKYSMQTAYWQLGFIAALEEKYTEAGKCWQKALGVSERMLGGRSFIGLGNTRGR